MKKVQAIMIFAIFLAGCNQQDTTKAMSALPKESASQMTQTVSHQPPPMDAATLHKETALRAPLYQSALANAKRLVDKADLPEANKIYDYVADHGVLAIPGKDGWMDTGNPKVQPGFSVVVLVQKDKAVGSEWGDVLSKAHASATFKPGIRLMMLDGESRVSPELQGVILMHESFHAYQGLVEGWKPVSPETFCLGEIGAHEFEGGLLEKLHPSYTQVVDEVEAKLEKSLGDPNFKFPELNAFIRANAARAIGRKSLSTEELGLMWVQIFYHANFKLADRKLSNDGDRLGSKIGFLKDWLERTHNSQW